MFSKRLAENFKTWPESALSGALLGLALAIAVLALWPGQALAKALALAWIVFP